MEPLQGQKCTACRPDAPPVTQEQIAKLQPQIPEWKIVDTDSEPKLERTYKLKDFASALELTNRIGAIAEDEGHHPAITVEYGKATLRWWTHAIQNLHVNDFIMAAKSDRAYEALEQEAPGSTKATPPSH
jgi:4a-hydroxytetrahydrobiopterin dehydratase